MVEWREEQRQEAILAQERIDRARQIRESRPLPPDALKPLIALSPKALEALLVWRPWQGRSCGGGGELELFGPSEAVTKGRE